MRIARNLSLAALVAMLAACNDSGGPTDATPPAAPAAETVISELQCEATLATGEISCVDPESTNGPRKVIYGTQGRDVRLNSSSPNYNTITQLYTFDVSVTNLRPEAIGTTDGVTLHPNGIRVFFGSGPTVTGGLGVVLVVNPDGTQVFLLGLAPFYQYNEVLQPNQTSTIKGWTLLVPLTVTSFTFNLYVSTEVGPAPAPSRGAPKLKV